MVYKPLIASVPHISDIFPCVPRRTLARRKSSYFVLLTLLICFTIVSRPIQYKDQSNKVSAKDILFGCPRLASYQGDQHLNKVGILTSARLEFDEVILKIASHSDALYYISPNGMMTPTMQRDLYLWSANESRSFEVALGPSKCSVQNVENVIERRGIEIFYVFYDHRDFPKYRDTDSVLEHLGCFVNVLDAIKEREVKKAMAKKASSFIQVRVILRLDLISRYQTLLFQKLSDEMRHKFDNSTSFSLGTGLCKAVFHFRNDYEAYFYSINTIAKVFRENYGLDITISSVY